MLKKIKATLVLVLPTLIIFSGIVNANANPKDCVSIFEELIKTSNFLPEVKSRKYFKIDLYDVSVTDESIFFKIYDSASTRQYGKTVSQATLGWIKYNYNLKNMENITYDEINPIKVIYNREIEMKFYNCMNINKINIKQFATEYE
ncbi:MULTISPECIES: hypothetical protein [unclassified Gilliamella]|uniref:hypothetical protein n=1 Tax=unclassified Gilliamella TaxID=2685620 RepID=UPI002269C477|nr:MULTISPECIES: hypothetical protein [unclassified Gilliamella]MCX8657103.1 hypothetical protein [Gilliamella sp. B2894]MCX8692824.1 hypothetical protein [Gilliamella sp. B2881]MCX8696983.1 hypothetical protein [Gilliamella sp. B2828]